MGSRLSNQRKRIVESTGTLPYEAKGVFKRDSRAGHRRAVGLLEPQSLTGLCQDTGTLHEGLVQGSKCQEMDYGPRDLRKR